MDAKLLFEEDSYIYLERYVNNGSPSGFHSRTTSLETSPMEGEERFPLIEFDDTDLECTYLGAEHPLFQRGVNYAHPDSLHSENLIGSQRKLAKSKLVVSPTSGGRTMLLRAPDAGGFLKLTYDVSRIGRVDRQLSLKHCQSSLEVSAAMKAGAESGSLPPEFSLLLEESAKVSHLRIGEAEFEWGTVYRDSRAYPYATHATALVPGFSLFGADHDSPDSPLLINQLIELNGSDPREYLLKVLRMIVDCYWSVVLACAFHPETHGQNCLFEVGEDFGIERLVIKDMDSIDKDLPLARFWGLRDTWDSDPYMCFDGRTYFYSIRPSFVYDFKVGEYLLSPLIDAVTSHYRIDPKSIEYEVRTYVKETYLWQLPNWYFPPDGCWYDCDNSERKPGTKRKYFAHENPKFR
jgi:hypothetical protein